MTKASRTPLIAPCLVILTALTSAVPASGQGLTLPPFHSQPNLTAPSSPEPTPFKRPSLSQPFVDGLGDFRHLPSRANGEWLLVGLGASLGAHSADKTSITWSNDGYQAFRPGAVIGGTPLELGAAF